MHWPISRSSACQAKKRTHTHTRTKTNTRVSMRPHYRVVTQLTFNPGWTIFRWSFKHGLNDGIIWSFISALKGHACLHVFNFTHVSPAKPVFLQEKAFRTLIKLSQAFCFVFYNQHPFILQWHNITPRGTYENCKKVCSIGYHILHLKYNLKIFLISDFKYKYCIGIMTMSVKVTVG